jgi:hypothetical protein
MISYLSTSQQVEAVNLWQKFDSVQKFHCKNDINHGKLSVGNNKGVIFLYCQHCNYVEVNIPEMIFQKYYLLKDL